MVFLRHYERIARLEHECHHCCRRIYPGDVYEGTVYAHDHEIYVHKQHIEPPCEPETPEEFEELFGKEESSDLELTVQSETVAALAA
jgi:hypothetical protein